MTEKEKLKNGKERNFDKSVTKIKEEEVEVGDSRRETSKVYSVIGVGRTILYLDRDMSSSTNYSLL